MKALQESLAAVAAITLAVCGLPAQAQEADRCRDVLAKGTYSVQEVRESNYLKQVMFSRLRTASYEEATDKTKIGFDVPGYFNGKYGREQHEFIQKSLKRDDFKEFRQDQQKYAYTMSGDSAILGKWAECMRTRHGVSIRFEPISPTRVWLHLMYHRAPGPTHPVFAVLKSDVKVPVEPEQNAECLRKGYKLDENGCTVTLVLPDHLVDFDVTLQTKEGNDQAYLPPRIGFEQKEESTPYPEERAKDLSTVVEYYKKVNQEKSFPTTVSMPADLRQEGWTFVPESFSVVPERKGDGTCVRSTAKARDPWVVELDNRIDLDPKDKPAKCIFRLKADIRKTTIVPVASIK